MSQSDPSSAAASSTPATFDLSETKVLTQKRFSTRTRFELRDEDFSYRLDTDGSSRTTRLEYAELSAERETLVERNSWWRNVGVLWMLLGAFSTVMVYTDQQVLRVSMWLWLGLACYGLYQFRTIRYLIIPSERSNVVIIDNAEGAEIVRELESRRARQLRNRYDYLALDEHPEQQRNRIQWLAKQGALEPHEVSARLLQLDAMASAHALAQDRREQDED